METEPTENSPYLPATSPHWAQYYKRAKQLRRLGKGQHASIQRDTKRRRRQANLMLLVSTAALALVVAAFYALLGTAKPPEPEGQNNQHDEDAAPLLTAHTRRG
jgi:hypothetical protein